MAEASRDAAPALITERGTTHVADKVLHKIARIAATEVPGVSQVDKGLMSRLTPGSTGLPDVRGRLAGDRAQVEIDIATLWPRPMAEVAAAVRDHVTERTESLLGVRVDRMDVHVSDVVREQTEQRRVR